MYACVFLLFPAALAQFDAIQPSRDARAFLTDVALTLAPCSASPAQRFQVNSGSIGVITPTPNPQSVCLCAPTTGAAGPLSLQRCEGGPPLHAFEVGFNFSGAAVAPIPWLPNNAQPASGLCATAAGANAPPQLQRCSGAANQMWRLDASSRLGTADGALCFEVAQPPAPLASTVFGSSMVFQRGASIDIWGAATPGGLVTVALSGQAPVAVRAAANGTWSVSLPPQSAGSGFNLTITDMSSGKTQLLTDVAFGDVFWCSGCATAARRGGRGVGALPWKSSGPSLTLFAPPLPPDTGKATSPGGTRPSPTRTTPRRKLPPLQTTPGSACSQWARPQGPPRPSRT
jgi:hypothetical protein